MIPERSTRGSRVAGVKVVLAQTSDPASHLRRLNDGEGAAERIRVGRCDDLADARHHGGARQASQSRDDEPGCRCGRRLLDVSKSSQVRGEQDALFRNCKCQDAIVIGAGHSLTDVHDVMPVFPQAHRESCRQILVTQDPHVDPARLSFSARCWGDLIASRKSRRVREARQHVFPGDLRVVFKQPLNRVARCEEVEDDVNGNSRSANARLSAAHLGINADACFELHEAKSMSFRRIPKSGSQSTRLHSLTACVKQLRHSNGH